MVYTVIKYRVQRRSLFRFSLSFQKAKITHGQEYPEYMHCLFLKLQRRGKHTLSHTPSNQYWCVRNICCQQASYWTLFYKQAPYWILFANRLLIGHFMQAGFLFDTFLYYSVQASSLQNTFCQQAFYWAFNASRLLIGHFTKNSLFDTLYKQAFYWTLAAKFKALYGICYCR